jgi:tetratricopeptide (TPR) repeat protein
MKDSIPVKRATHGIDSGRTLGGKSSSIEGFSMSDGDLLSSWKEIAAYLGCDIKTCGRWEKESGLPIRRISPGSKRSRVFAYQSDLDRWLTERNFLASPAAHEPARTAKRRPLMVAAAALLIGAPAVWFVGRAISPAPLPPLLAVREIRHGAIQAFDRYLAKQMTELIIQRLEFGGRLRIQKISDAAPEFESGKPVSPGPLRPDYLFEARLKPAGAKYSLAVELKDTRTGRALYADAITAAADEFGLPLSSVCEEIRQRIPETTGSGAPAPSAVHGEAYVNSLMGGFLLSLVGNRDSDPLTLYYKGIKIAGLGQAETNELAMTLFKKAVELDPSFALGYLGLAECFSNYVNYDGRYDPKWLDKAEGFMAQAQALAPDLAEYFTLRIKALLLREIVFGGDFSREYFDLAKKALALHPYNGRLRYVVGHCYVRLFERDGRDADFEKALAHYKIACAAEPAALGNLNYAELLMLRRKFSQSLRVVDEVLDGRASPYSSFARGAILYYQGDLEGSRTAFEACDSTVEQKIAALYYLAMIAARKGDRGRAENLMRQIELLEIRKEPMYLDHVRAASVYAGLGRVDKAMDLLREGYKALGKSGVSIMKLYVEIDPNFARLPGNLVAR